MDILENVSLKPYNTFGINAYARYFTAFTNIDELTEVLSSLPTINPQPPTLILGGGSNILFIKDFDGIVLKNELKGIELVSEDEDHYYIKAAAGENWHQFVLHCINNNYAGVENLSLIPGNVGASPMQNIGAYGVEIKDVFHRLDAYHTKDRIGQTFNIQDCEFGYRESAFKHKYKDQFIIISVTYRLNKKPVLNTSYGAIQQELDKMKIDQLSIKDISQAVINIRSSKLPNPAEIGNAGSFFKNPTIPTEHFEALQKEYPNIVGHLSANNTTKVAAGWLIEQCGWKGYRKGDAGCHAKQALVLVNYGNAKGEEIYHLSSQIMDSVQQRFAIHLEREVNII